jgi:hypothetical protein
MTALAPILEAFFTDRLMTQQGVSPHTIASYRDTFKLLERVCDLGGGLFVAREVWVNSW